MATKYSNKNIATQVATPVGTIIMVGKNGAPTGFLLCNGASLLRADYPELFAMIGTAWGAADGTHFNLPDLRGRMPRGRDNGAGRDPDAAGRTANATGGATGDNVGSVQAQATRKNGLPDPTASSSAVSGSTGTGTAGNGGSHNHTGGGAAQSALVYTGQGGAPAFGSSGGGSFVSLNSVGDHAHSVPSLSISGTAAAQSISLGNGDNETRPVNANVDFAIKY